MFLVTLKVQAPCEMSAVLPLTASACIVLSIVCIKLNASVYGEIWGMSFRNLGHTLCNNQTVTL